MTPREQSSLTLAVILVLLAILLWATAEAKTIEPQEIEDMNVLLEAYLYQIKGDCWLYIKQAPETAVLYQVNCPVGI